jgi:2-keto-4-pentenoate hydratase/2-oxohepta-3-ene-1,7-dioic acid hydratase in catechol pathway
VSEPERRVRFRAPDGAVYVGRLEGALVRRLKGQVWGPATSTDQTWPLERVRLLAPLRPSKVVGIASNYRAHAREMGKPIPKVPKIFLMASTAVVGPGDPIPLPSGDLHIDHEAELGLVIGVRATRVPADQAHRVIAGITCVNDVTCRDHQRADGTFSRGKSRDGFCPIGPSVALGLDPSNLRVQCRINGQTVQDGRSDDLIFDAATLVAFVTDVMTLLPGDVIATGTPSGVGPLAVGDTVEVEVEGVGVLRNPVVARD